MSRDAFSGAKVPEVYDDSVATTLKVIMDVLKSHEGSIKELHNVLNSHGNMMSGKVHIPPLSNIHTMNGEEEPVKDIDDIPDNQSEVSSIMSSRTEYHELPTRSTILSSTGISGKEGFPLSDMGHSKTLVSSTTGLTLTSTPLKLPSSSPHQHFPTRTSNTRTPKLEQLSAVSAVLADDHTHGQVIPTSSQPYSLHTPPSIKPDMVGGIHRYSPFPSTGYSVGALHTKIQLLESQVSEWGDIIDEMSDRMANQPSLIRKFAKESTTDKVSHRQHTEDLEVLERKLSKKIDDKFANLDRKIIELYDDLMSQVTNLPAAKAAEEKKTQKQVSLGIHKFDLDSLKEKLDEQDERLKAMSKGMSALDDKMSHLKQDMTLYRRQHDNKRGDDESEINTSVHHSYATLDKRTEAMSQKLQLHGRWRWTGVSNLYPKAHSCVAVDQMTDDISFTSQVHNTETRSLVWEKGKPYVVVTTGGCYWVAIGAFSKKTSTPPSLQVTIDEEPVPLYNSSGKSPSHHRISVISSAPKYQPPAGRIKGDGSSPWRPGSSLIGTVIIPAHSRVSVSPTSTAPGTRMSVEGYLEVLKMY